MARVVVVGAGPAGIAASIAAAENGATVTLIDDNLAPGGQIWRKSAGKEPNPKIQKLFQKMAPLGIETKYETAVIEAAQGSVVTSGPVGSESIEFDTAVLCTGARELFLPFSGWTLPGVMGAGGAQALLKGGANFEGKRVVVSGSGPLLIAVAAAFASSGAEVVGVFEQATTTQLLRFGLKSFNPSRFREGLGYFLALGTTPYETGTWAFAAHGRDALESVTLTDGERFWGEPCDLLACAYGLVPNTELAELLGCDIANGVVTTNHDLETSVKGIYSAGEPLGIGGLDLALAEGTLAGCCAASKDSPAARRLVNKLKPFRQNLAESFKLRPEILNLADNGTILCRCEDVKLGAINPNWSQRQAKLYTRIGMGPCQGRVCGPAARCLFEWEPDRARPPLFPTEVNILAANKAETS